jgi:hypothetical protein
VDDAAVWAATLIASNGTWPDIVYTDSADRTAWKAAAHTGRVQALAAAVSMPGHALHRDARAFATARRALAGWLRLDPPNTNWWWIILQSPQTLSASTLMLSLVGNVSSPAFPTAAELELGLSFMFRAAWWNASLGYEVTGANLAWMMQTQLTRGVLPTAVNESALAQGFARLWQEVKIVNDTNDGANQGIQVDGAYHMHAAQLQVLSYGQDYLQEILLFFTVAADTAYALPADLAGVVSLRLCSRRHGLADERPRRGLGGGRSSNSTARRRRANARQRQPDAARVSGRAVRARRRRSRGRLCRACARQRGRAAAARQQAFLHERPHGAPAARLGGQPAHALAAHARARVRQRRKPARRAHE